MIVTAARVKLYAPWVHSLKEKRMVVQSLITKVSNKFNVSIAEVAEQDIHQTAVLGVACVSDSSVHGEAVIDEVVRFIEGNTEAEVIEVLKERL